MSSAVIEYASKLDIVVKLVANQSGQPTIEVVKPGNLTPDQVEKLEDELNDLHQMLGEGETSSEAPCAFFKRITTVASPGAHNGRDSSSIKVTVSVPFGPSSPWWGKFTTVLLLFKTVVHI